MSSRRLMPSMIALLAGCALAACASLPDPSHPGKARDPDRSTLSRPQILAGVLTRVAHNAEKARDWEAAHMFYARAHDLDKAKPGPLVGMGRALLALNEPMQASEAYGGALALEPGNEEAEAGLNKALDQIALNSSRHPPADLPALASLAETEPGDTAAEETVADETVAEEMVVEETAGGGPDGMNGETAPAADMAKAMPADGPDPAQAGEPAAEQPPREAETAASGVASAETGETATDKATTGETVTETRVNMDDVLSAIEWKEAHAPAPLYDAEAEKSRQVASAAPEAAGAPVGKAPIGKTMSDAVAGSAKSDAMAGDLFRLQLSASASRPKTVSLRERVETTAKDLLDGVGLQIEEQAAAGGKPVYKLRTGTVGGRDEAARLCNKLQIRAFDCFLVKADGPPKTAIVAQPTVTASTEPAKAPAEATPDPQPAPAPVQKTAAAGKTTETKDFKGDDAPVMGWEIVDTSEEVPGMETEGENAGSNDTGANPDGPAETADAGQPGGEDPPQENAADGETPEGEAPTPQ